MKSIRVLFALLLCFVAVLANEDTPNLRGVPESQVERMLSPGSVDDCKCACVTRDHREGQFMLPMIHELEKAAGGYFCERQDRVETLIKQGRAYCARDCRRARRMVRQ